VITLVKPSASEETLSGYLQFMTRYGVR